MAQKKKADEVTKRANDDFVQGFMKMDELSDVVLD